MEYPEEQLKKLLEKTEWTVEEKRWLLNYLENSEATELNQLMLKHFEKVHESSELVLHLHNDDVKSFDILYGKYHAALYDIILKLTRDGTIAEDIVQEVFISLWEMRHSIDSEHAISGWLFTVGFSKSINHLKQVLR